MKTSFFWGGGAGCCEATHSTSVNNHMVQKEQPTTCQPPHNPIVSRPSSTPPEKKTSEQQVHVTIILSTPESDISNLPKEGTFNLNGVLMMNSRMKKTMTGPQVFDPWPNTLDDGSNWLM